MGNQQSSLYWKINCILPENKNQSSWGFDKANPFTDDKDREQFVHACVTVITNNGHINLQKYTFRLLFARREDDRLVARIVAELDGIIRAKIEPDADGKDQAEAFNALRRDVETKLEKILRAVPSEGNFEDVVAGPSQRGPMGRGKPIPSMDFPPSYEGEDVKLLKN
ncbi:hypothetical protein LTR56_005544 [Elasticomyces elasticus]|nr:hypothetical protein LTR22_017131 [Elasticomyces elasticus]KAK3651736.1 hypothetical protein LTR56_005544 [Elasticomyces elasticus]KAK4913359.1 hypothetical protein LTR49_018340 [Elasticomyces elasticus]KAK5769165.1 hypothetical protein LTS12_000516 [Elasticomyces elasticus]